MIKKMLTTIVVGSGLIGFLTGCEWQSSGGSESWSDKYSWVNFSGVYRAPDSGLVVRSAVQVAAVAAAASTNALPTIVAVEQVGTGNGLVLSFSGTLGHRPLTAKSLTITDGFETFSDGGGTGVLTGDKGGTGTISYGTGAFTVTFATQPGLGIAINATYTYSELPGGSAASGGTQGSSQGSSISIYTLTVSQQGNLLNITDSNGAVYTGKMGNLSSSGGFANGNVLSGSSVIAQFTATGISASGRSVKIVGNLSGTYIGSSGGSSGATSSGTGGTTSTQWLITGRSMEGTWIEDGGRLTGDIKGVAGDASVTITGVGTNTTSAFKL